MLTSFFIFCVSDGCPSKNLIPQALVGIKILKGSWRCPEMKKIYFIGLPVFVAVSLLIGVALLWLYRVQLATGSVIGPGPYGFGR